MSVPYRIHTTIFVSGTAVADLKTPQSEGGERRGFTPIDDTSLFLNGSTSHPSFGEISNCRFHWVLEPYRRFDVHGEREALQWVSDHLRKKHARETKPIQRSPNEGGVRRTHTRKNASIDGHEMCERPQKKLFLQAKIYKTTRRTMFTCVLTSPSSLMNSSVRDAGKP